MIEHMEVDGEEERRVEVEMLRRRSCIEEEKDSYP